MLIYYSDVTVFEIRANNHCGGVMFEHFFMLKILKQCSKFSPPQWLFALLTLSRFLPAGETQLPVQALFCCFTESDNFGSLEIFEGFVELSKERNIYVLFTYTKYILYSIIQYNFTQ